MPSPISGVRVSRDHFIARINTVDHLVHHHRQGVVRLLPGAMIALGGISAEFVFLHSVGESLYVSSYAAKGAALSVMDSTEGTVARNSVPARSFLRLPSSQVVPSGSHRLKPPSSIFYHIQRHSRSFTSGFSISSPARISSKSVMEMTSFLLLALFQSDQIANAVLSKVIRPGLIRDPPRLTFPGHSFLPHVFLRVGLELPFSQPLRLNIIMPLQIVALYAFRRICIKADQQPTLAGDTAVFRFPVRRALQSRPPFFSPVVGETALLPAFSFPRWAGQGRASVSHSVLYRRTRSKAAAKPPAQVKIFSCFPPKVSLPQQVQNICGLTLTITALVKNCNSLPAAKIPPPMRERENKRNTVYAPIGDRAAVISPICRTAPPPRPQSARCPCWRPAGNRSQCRKAAPPQPTAGGTSR